MLSNDDANDTLVGSWRARMAGVAVTAPETRPKIDATTNVTMKPGLAWAAGKMQSWRERSRPAAIPGHTEWHSAEEIAGALAYGVQPVIRHLAQSLVALMETANAAAAADEGALHSAAARTEALLALWDEVRADLRARRFPVRHWSGERLFHGILMRLDRRLDALFTTVVELTAQPLHTAVRHADATGTVTLSVSFDCEAEVRRLADWAHRRWPPESSCDWG